MSELPAPADVPAPWLQVPRGRQALALASASFCKNPDRKLNLTGITGTNGKTTTSYLLDSILREAGFTTALIGTIEYHLGSKILPAANTTPESLDLFVCSPNSMRSAALTRRWKSRRMPWPWAGSMESTFILRFLQI